MTYETFREKNSELGDRRLIIGVSGGVDSMVLLDLCSKLGAEITGVHVNYGLRDVDSDGDETLIREYCTKLGIACHVTHVNAVELKREGINLQQKAREIRYEAYDESLVQTQSDYILTAHHLDDSIETTVMNFFRGTDLNGLTGITHWKHIRRPLITFTKSEILEYARANGIEYREDKSNATDDYTRNQIRNTLLPQLDKTFPSITKRLTSTIENLKAVRTSHQTAMDYLVAQHVIQSGKDMILPFDGIDSKLEEHLLIYWGGQYGLSRAQMQNLFDIKDRVGKKVENTEYCIVIDREGYLLFSNTDDPRPQSIHIEQEGFNAFLGNQLKITDDTTQAKNALHTIALNKEKLLFPLIVRYWMPGDKITYSLSPKQSKKLKKLFNDHKVKSSDKHRTPILVNSDGELVWVVGLQKNPMFVKEGGYAISIVSEDSKEF